MFRTVYQTSVFTKILLCLSIFVPLNNIFSQALEKTLKEYIKDYPQFDVQKFRNEASTLTEQIRMAETGQEVMFSSKIGVNVKGKYYGRTSSGGVEIGMGKVSWIDMPDEYKYLFERSFFDKKIKDVIKSYVQEKQQYYDFEKNGNIENYKTQLLSKQNNLLLSPSRIIYGFEIVNVDLWSVTLKHSAGTETIKYSNIPEKELKKISTNINVLTANGTIYKNVFPICKNVISLEFKTQYGELLNLRFKDLKEVVCKKFGYSEAEESSYWQKQKEDEEKRRLAAEKKGFWEKVEKIVMSKIILDTDFKVLQSMEHGALCVLGRRGYEGRFYYDGETFMLYGNNDKIIADGDVFSGDLYFAGTCIYTNMLNNQKTVNAYSVNKAASMRIIIIKLGLKEPGSSENADDFYDTDDSRGTRNKGDSGEHSSRAFGSGFFVSRDGYIVTNNHVVAGSKRIKVKTASGEYVAKLVGLDKVNDLALIKIDVKSPVKYLSFSDESSVKLGQTIFTVGFPMPQIQGFAPKVTKGVISSLKGMQDDVRSYQIDASIQPGNSGGPLSDENGNLVGVLVAKLNEGVLLHYTGNIPQNVNYAVKKTYLESFLKGFEGIKIEYGSANKERFEESVEKVNQATVLILVE